MKHLFAFIIAVLTLAACTTKTATQGEDAPQLRFKDGKFKIAQIADMHWNDDKARTDEITKTLTTLIKKENPQLIILTGDNVTDAPDLATAKKEWQDVIDMLESTGLPYAIVQGNHDGECCEGMCADTLEVWLTQMGHHLLNYPTTTKCYGHGNKALEILSEKSDSVASVVYVIDSNSYPEDEELHLFSGYDWIHADEIAWYAAESEKYTAQNGGKPLPSLAYYHICVPEFNIVVNDPSRFGKYAEPCCPATVNSGFLCSAFCHKDIMGMFVGHDHTNDFCGIYAGIALCYGRQSGVAGMEPGSERGIRFVEMNEGQRAFSTWIETDLGKTATWYYPTGCNSDMTEHPNPAVEIGEVKNGVNYTYYEGEENENTAAMLVEKNQKSTGVINNFDITKAPAEDHFGYLFDTYFMAEETGPYRFTLLSDDGSQLLIDDQLLVDLDGSHSREKASNNVGLAKGLHHLQVRYFEDYEGQELNVEFATADHGSEPIPDNLLFIKK